MTLRATAFAKVYTKHYAYKLRVASSARSLTYIKERQGCLCDCVRPKHDETIDIGPTGGVRAYNGTRAKTSGINLHEKK